MKLLKKNVAIQVKPSYNLRLFTELIQRAIR